LGRRAVHLTQAIISLSHGVVIEKKARLAAMRRGSSVEMREWDDPFTADLAVTDPESSA